MINGIYENPARILFGKDMGNKVGEEVGNYSSKVLLHYGGKSFKERGLYGKVRASLTFTDAPEILCEAGVSAGCVPGGGKRESEVKELFNKKEVKVFYLPDDIRGFCRH